MNPTNTTTTTTAGNDRNFGKDQRLFLRLARDGNLTLEELTLRMNLKNEVVSRWLRSKRFRAALNARLREVRRRAKLELRLASAPAARTLTALGRGDKHSLTANDHVKRLSCINIISLAREEERADERRQRERQVVRAKRDADERAALLDSMPHPDVPPEEIPALRQLLGE